MQLTFDQIDFFMSCAVCLNFSLAAKYHFVSVSTLSRSISALEEELGIKLFNRGYHGHSLTDAGKEFFSYCMNSVVRFNKYVNKWSDVPNDKIIIGCYPDNSSFRNLISTYSNAFPELHPGNIKVSFVPTGQMLRHLAEGTIDIALIGKSELGDVAVFDCIPFYKEGEEEYFLVSLKTRDVNYLKKISPLSKYFK